MITCILFSVQQEEKQRVLLKLSISHQLVISMQQLWFRTKRFVQSDMALIAIEVIALIFGENVSSARGLFYFIRGRHITYVLSSWENAQKGGLFCFLLKGSALFQSHRRITQQQRAPLWSACQLHMLDSFNIIVLLERCNLQHGSTVNVIAPLPSRFLLCCEIRHMYKSPLLH